MSDNRGLSSSLDDVQYNSLSTLINYNYCKINGYDFIYYQPYYKELNLTSIYNCVDPNSGELRHPSWSKLLSVIKSIDLGFEYIVYIDSDAIFRTLDYTIEKFINKHLGKNDFIFLDNSPNPDVHIEKSVCCGFFILKNNETTKKNIIDWYKSNLSFFNKHQFYEQSALWSSHLDKMRISVATEYHFHEDPGQFIRHLHSGIMGYRLPYFNNVIKEQDLNLIDILKVKWIQYDTSEITF
jgi:hypothetical protein